MRTLEKIILKQLKTILYRLTGDHCNLADFKLVNFIMILQVIYKKKSIFGEPKVTAFYVNNFLTASLCGLKEQNEVKTGMWVFFLETVMFH